MDVEFTSSTGGDGCGRQSRARADGGVKQKQLNNIRRRTSTIGMKQQEPKPFNVSCSETLLHVYYVLRSLLLTSLRIVHAFPSPCPFFFCFFSCDTLQCFFSSHSCFSFSPLFPPLLCFFFYTFARFEIVFSSSFVFGFVFSSSTDSIR